MPPAEFYDFLESAARAHHDKGYNFPVIFDDHFNGGYVFKTPKFFMLAGEDRRRTDAWFVWWAEVHPSIRNTFEHISLLLACVPEYRPYIAFARVGKGRPEVKYYSTDRLMRFRRASRSNA